MRMPTKPEKSPVMCRFWLLQTVALVDFWVVLTLEIFFLCLMSYVYDMAYILLFVSYLYDLDFHAHDRGSRVIYRCVM